MDISLYEREQLMDELYEEMACDIEGVSRPGLIFIGEDNEEFCSNTGVTASKFITIEGRRYFIKYPTLSQYPARHEIFAELLTTFIAKKVGFDCVDCRLAVDHSQRAIGIISPDFGEHFLYADIGGKIKYGLDSSTCEEVADLIIDKFKEFKYVEINRKELIEKLNKMSCFDYLTNQRDRHSQNFAFTIREINGVKKLDLAPIYDNANAFLRVYARLFRLNPNDCEIYGMEQQKLLNSTYKDMLIKFQTLFGEKFEDIKKEFEQYYGLDVLFSRLELDDWWERTQTNVKEKVEQCRFRCEGAKFIPLEAIYAVVLRHKTELEEDEYDKVVKRIVQDLCEYMDESNFSDSYKNFTKQKSGELAMWKWYDECEELSRHPDSPEIKNAKKILDKKRKEYNTTILSYAMERRFIEFNIYNQLKYLFFDVESIPFSRPVIKSYAEYTAGITFSAQYPVFKELRAWCAETERRKDLSIEEKNELVKTKKLLKRYLKYYTAIFKKQIKHNDERVLNDIGLRFDGKLGIVEVGDENKNLL